MFWSIRTFLITVYLMWKEGEDCELGSKTYASRSA